MNICVYCSSSNRIRPEYFAAADRLGQLLAHRGDTLVYGGGDVGLMGAVARAVHREGGSVFGVIPEALKKVEGVAYAVADELITTATMGERKTIMFTRADAFVVLPGGFGTLEEFIEVLTLRHLGYHNKPIAVVNVEGFYDPLTQLFEHFYGEQFARPSMRLLYHLAETPEEALEYIAAPPRDAGGQASSPARARASS